MAVKQQVITKTHALYLGDCCEVLPDLPEESIGFSIFSPPFCDLYSYSDSPQDMGNAKGYEEFFVHFSFLVEQLARLMKPGRIVAVHCMDLPTHKSSGMEIGLRDFPGDIIKCFQQKGFVYHSRHCIWKDPLVAATRTKAIGLAHHQLIKDSSLSRTGIPDYIVAFRKKGDNDIPICHPKGLTDYHGARSVPGNLERYLDSEDQGKNKRSHWIWQQYASPVWFDIRQTRVLPYKKARESDDEKHICLARGSRVLVKERGYVPIQWVRVDEHVLTHMGRWRPVLAVQNTGEREVITISAQGVPHLTLTPTHKLWVRKSDWVRQRDGAERTDPQWIEAKDCLGGYLNLKLPEVDSSTSDLCGEDLLRWWIVGRWLADGHWDARGGAHISCGYHKYQDLKNSMGEYAGFAHDTGTGYQIRVLDHDRNIRDVLSRCGIEASDKHIPPEAFVLPPEQAGSLLSGYLSGDGHYREDRRRWMATSVSYDLLLGLAVLVQRAYNSIASIHSGRPEREGVIEGRRVHCKQEWILSFDLPDHDRYKKQFILPDGAWKKVRSIQCSEKAETWNLRVAEDESFTAEGCVVKNCPLQLDTIERCMALWSTEGDTVLTPFMGVGSEVYVAVRNGRRGIGVELKRSYFRQAVRNVKVALRKGLHGEKE